MAIQYTPAQNTAIQYTQGNLLLSAAAGSGKTATLTGKILHLLEQEEATLGEMLIVTYTRAAAAELRDRIGAGITGAAKKGNGRKMAQHLASVGNAEISTIHSFLYRNLRPHFASLGLSPDFAIGDEAAMESLRQDAMRDTLDDFFDQPGEHTADFIALADALSGAKDAASLDKTLLSMAGHITAAGNTPSVLLTYADTMEKGAAEGFFTMPQSEPIKKRLLLLTDHVRKCCAYCLDAFRDTPVVMEKYGEAAEGLTAYCAFLEMLVQQNDYTTIRNALRDYTPIPIKPLSSKNATDASELFKDVRDTCKKEFAKLADRYFASPEEVLSDTLSRTAALLRSASMVLDTYFAAYRAKKYSRSLLDYNDLESFALTLFLDENGHPTDAAEEVGRKYKYIFIDEYQDTNRVQDAIFRAIAGNASRFMVGDIKQSIYRFRGAEPSVFSHYREIWPTISPDTAEEAAFSPDDGRCLFMSENFRCDETVVDFVNLVSDVLFGCGGIPYTADDALVFRKDKEEDTPVEICLIEKRKADEEEAETEADPEAEYVAERIKQLLSEDSLDGVQPVKPENIAILLRSPESGAGEYRAALAKRGIPVTLQNTALLFTSPAVLLVMCLLHTADNPLSDIYTAGAMHSPLFGFTTEDLVSLHRFGGDVPLYVTVKMAVLPEEEWAFPEEEESELSDTETFPEEADTGVEIPETDADDALSEELPDALLERCRHFLTAVDTLRDAARGMRADRFLDTLYRDWSLYDLPEIRENPVEQGNLQALYDLARRFESGTFGGIAGFLQYIEELKSREKEKTPEEAGGAVTILSIHRSKGLEFPVVFLCECAKKRNTRDEEGDVLYDADLGFGMRLPDPGGLVRCGTTLRSGIGEKIRRDSIEEEMRILYVAMTRARKRLIITAKTKDPEADLAEYSRYADLVTPWRIVDGSSYMDWILTAVTHHGFSPCYTLKTVENIHQAETDGETISETAAEQDTGLLDRLRENCGFVYPYTYLADIPVKLTVSRLYPTILDEADTTEDMLLSGISPDMPEEQDEAPAAMPLPRFMTGMTDTVTPADRGTATHVFLQFADFTKLRDNGVEAELRRLTEEQYITSEMAENVYTGQLNKFRESDLFRRMCTAKEIWREFRFNAAMDAARFTADTALAEKLSSDGIQLTVQGVVDCVFRDADGHLVLVDYKTDHPYGAEFRDPTLADERFRKRHADQLCYYREICEKLFGEAIGETLIYSTALCREIPVA